MMRERAVFVLLVCMTAFGVALSAYTIFTRSIWFDESITLMELAGHARPQHEPGWYGEPRSPAEHRARVFTGNTTPAKLVRDLLETDMHPPLYYLALLPWRAVAGPSLESIRLFSFATHIAALVLLYLIAGRLGGYTRTEKSGLLAFYALCASGVYMGAEARNYAVTTLLMLAGILSLLRSWQESTPERAGRWALLAGGLWGATMLSDYLWLAPSLFLLAYCAFAPVQVSRRLRWFPLAGFLVVASIAIPFLSVHLFSRPDEAAGFPGWLNDLRRIQLDSLRILYFDLADKQTGTLWVVTSATIAFAVYHWRGHAPWLALGLALAPLVQVLALDVAFDKSISGFGHNSPANVGLVLGLWLGWVGARRIRALGGLLLMLILGGAMMWGSWRMARFGPSVYFQQDTRAYARHLCEQAAPNAVLFVDGESGRGDPGQWIFELRCEVKIQVWPELYRRQRFDFPSNEIWIPHPWSVAPMVVAHAPLWPQLHAHGYREVPTGIESRLKKFVREN